MEFANVYFLLTSNCNLRCKYCFQEDNYHARPKTAVTRQVIDDFIAFAAKNNFRHIELFGGEPLFYKEQAVYAVKAIRERLPGTSVGMVTNGTLIDEEIMRLLEENPVNVLLSLDGRPERHDAFRGGFSAISRWIPRLAATGRVNVALQAGAVHGLYDQVAYVWELGFKNVFINVIQNYGWYKPEDVALFETEYEKTVRGMLAGKGHLACAVKLHLLLESDKIDDRCGITGEGLTSDWQGRFYPCHRAVELGEQFIIGDIYQGINDEISSRLRQKIREQCRASASTAKYPLISFCPVSVYQQHADFAGDWSTGFCDILNIKMKIVAKYHYQIEEYIRRRQGKNSGTEGC